MNTFNKMSKISTLCTTESNEHLLQVLIDSENDWNVFREKFWRGCGKIAFAISEFREYKIDLNNYSMEEFVSDYLNVSKVQALSKLFQEFVTSGGEYEMVSEGVYRGSDIAWLEFRFPFVTPEEIYIAQKENPYRMFVRVINDMYYLVTDNEEINFYHTNGIQSVDKRNGSAHFKNTKEFCDIRNKYNARQRFIYWFGGQVKLSNETVGNDKLLIAMLDRNLPKLIEKASNYKSTTKQRDIHSAIQMIVNAAFQSDLIDEQRFNNYNYSYILPYEHITN